MEIRIEDAPCGCPRFRIEPSLGSGETVTCKCVHSAVQPAAKKKAKKSSISQGGKR